MRHTGPQATIMALVASCLILLTEPDTAVAQGLADWTIMSTFVGGLGEDIPLRVETHDVPGRDGFGVRHIVDGHGAVPEVQDIEAVLSQSAQTCKHFSVDQRSRCSLEIGNIPLFVVFTEQVRSDSGDGRPVGIITAYYSPRGDCPC